MENKRIWAMVGVVYVILATCLMTYWIATTTLLQGLTGVMLTPLCLGLCVQCFNSRWKALHGTGTGNPRIFFLLGLAAGLASCLSLYLGCREVLAHLS